MFANKQFVEATGIYVRLLSLQPRNHDYNFKYGACLLFNSKNKQDAIRYLKYAITGDVTDPALYYFLGRAYHLNYQFNDALREYQQYTIHAGSKGEYFNEAERNMQMCNNGKKLLTTLTDIVVTKKTDIVEKDFFRIYDLENIGGKIIVAADFQSKNDKKNNHLPLVHFPEKAERVFFSSYGDGDQLDLYVVRRLPDGSFGQPQKISGEVNTAFDENYPYLHPNGQDLYFSSKGHNSMGGYDVFKAKYDAETNTFGQVENIDFAISSPDDDLFYIVDKDEKNAYFASKRQSQDGKIYVYQVYVDRVPIQLAIVKGFFSSTVDPQLTKVSVDVTDLSTGKGIGRYNSGSDASYLITFPKGGKYEYSIKLGSSEIVHKVIVEIPFLKEIRPLKQKIIHEVVDGKEQVRIVNLFDEQIEDAQGIIAQVLKDRSNLEVNVTNFDIQEIQGNEDEQKILAEIGLSRMRLIEVGLLLEQRSSELAIASPNSSDLQNSVNAKVLSTYNEIAELDKKIKELVKIADQSNSNFEKRDVLMNAKELFDKRKTLLTEIDEIQKINTEVNSSNQNDNSFSIQEFTAVSEQIADLIESKQNEQALQLIQQNADLLQEGLNYKDASYIDELLASQATLDTEIDGMNRKIANYSSTIRNLQAELRTLNEQLGNVKEKEKQAIQDKIDAVKETIRDNEAAQQKIQTQLFIKSDERKVLSDKIIRYNSIGSAKSAKVVTSQEVVNAKNAISNENAKALKAYVENSLAELEKENLALISSTNSQAKNIIQEHSTHAEDIMKNDLLSESEKYEEIITQNNATIEALKERKAVLDAKKQSESLSEKEIYEYGEITDFVMYLEGENQEFDTKVKIENFEEITYSPMMIHSEVSPDYMEKRKEIQTSETFSELEKLTKTIELDKAYLKLLEEETVRMQERLFEEPGDINARNKLSAIENIQENLVEGIQLSNEKIEGLNRGENPDLLAVLQISVSEELELAQKKYKDTRAEITDKSLEEIDVLTEKHVATTTYLNSLNQQAEKLEIALSENQGNVNLENQLNELKQIIESIESEKLDLENGITTIQNPENNHQPNNQLTNNHQPNNQTTNNQTTNNQPTNEERLENIRNSYSPNIASVLQSRETDLASLKKQDSELQAYEEQLKRTLTRISQEPNSAERDANISVIQAEQDAVSQKRREISVEIGELETLAQTNNHQPNNQTTNNQLTNNQPTNEERLENIRNSYSPNIASVLQSRETDLASLKKQDSELQAYEEQLKRTLTRINQEPNSAERDANISVIQAEQEVVSQKRREISVEIGELETLAQTNNHQPNNQTTNNQLTNNQPTNEERLENIRNSYSSNIASVLQSRQTDLASLKKQDSELQAYEEQLKRTLTRISQEPNSAERDANISVIQAEQDAVSQKRREISVEIGELETLAQTNNHQPNNQTTNNQLTNNQPTNEERLENIRNSYSPNIASVLQSRETDLASLKNQDSELQAYEEQLKRTLTRINQEPNSAERDANISVIQAEQDVVSQKRREISVEIGELETLAQTNNHQPNNQITTNHPTTNQTTSQLTKSELEEIIQSNASQIEEELLKNPVQNESTKRKIENDLTEVKVLQKQLEKNKSEEAQKHILANISEKQKEIKVAIDNELFEIQERELVEQIGFEGIYTVEQLETKKRNVSIEIGNLETEILNKEKALSIAKTKERASIENELNVLRLELKKNVELESEITAAIDKLPTEIEIAKSSAKQTPITYNEEREIAYSEEYLNYATSMNEARSIEAQLINAQNAKMEAQERLQQLMNNQVLNESNRETQINEETQKIRNFTVEIVDLTTTLEEKLRISNEYLPTEEMDRLKFQNLMLRGVNPIKKAIIVSALVPLPASGIEINPNGVTNLNTSKPIPVDIQTPRGLIYRVQVGAFVKPISPEVFKEFTPISGELIPNTNVTRYMAGYFNNSKRVVEVKDQIRSLGYSDAFVVAYCDGKRISFAEARQLEASGQCLPQQMENIQLDIANHGVEDTSKRLLPVSEYTYNKAPGAAKAEPIEIYQGLFFTVQIGVYNTPVPHSQLLNLEPLMTLRLENGQIRYSCGMFTDLPEAKKREGEIRTKGIKDAFVTAYYKGERIGWQKAVQLLETEGTKILAERTKPDIVVEEATDKPIQRIEVAEVYTSVLASKRQNNTAYQFVSKEVYDEYPRDVLIRYNNKGTFYYDQNDRKVKSIVYETEYRLPIIGGFKEHLDTIQISAEQLAEMNSGYKLKVLTNTDVLAGDFADWIIGQSYRTEIIRSENGLELIIFVNSKEQFEDLEPKISVFGYEVERISVKE